MSSPSPAPTRPRIVVLCGSTRFWRSFQQANLEETLAGRIVLSIGAATGTDDDHFAHLAPDEYAGVKARLDALHLCKIDLADEVLVLNDGGYIGESTSREVAYALAQGKPVRWRSLCGACHGPYHGAALCPADCDAASRRLALRLLAAAETLRLGELGARAGRP